MEKVSEVRATRWTIEEDIQSAKGECGLDEYETRGWVGWHHHKDHQGLAPGCALNESTRILDWKNQSAG